MQPVKIRIEGEYWDSFIYKGRLYLFHANGEITSIHWDELIDDWNLHDDIKLAFSFAFNRSDYLYLPDSQILLHDPEIKSVVVQKFSRLADIEFGISRNELENYIKGQQTTPSVFPHSDIEIYKDQLFVASKSGLYRLTCNKKTKYPISTKKNKCWDGSVLSISAAYGSVALAAGNDGLFEYAIEGNHSTFPYSSEPERLSELSCKDCSWNYYSVFASGDNSGYLADFMKGDNRDDDFRKLPHRIFDSVITAESMFGTSGYSWGMHDKICQAQLNSIKVLKYEPWSRYDDRSHYRTLGTIHHEEWKGEIVSASTANFGIIVELENAIVVYPSAGDPITIPGEPVSWRVFPRSKRYENQLHVIYDDHILIYSFNHDYLLDQKEKIAGTSVFGRSLLNSRFHGAFL